MSSTDPARAAPRFWKKDTFTLEIEPARSIKPARPIEEDVLDADHYEILRVDPQADEETIERVYKTLARRFHPDTPSTGDPETFLRIRKAWETLSDPARRAKYNVLLAAHRNSVRFRLRGREFFDGVRGEQNRRLAALCLLYRQRIGAHESPGLTLLDLERLTGLTREELASGLWYLCKKKWVKFGEFTEYSITAGGVDIVESKLEERLEFRALATVCYYGSPGNAVGRLLGQRAPEPALLAAPEPVPAPASETGTLRGRIVHEDEPSRRRSVTLVYIMIAVASVFIAARFVVSRTRAGSRAVP
jgi:hypothetical protein